MGIGRIKGLGEMRLRMLVSLLLLLVFFASIISFYRIWDIQDEVMQKVEVGEYTVKSRFIPSARIESPTLLYGSKELIKYGKDEFFASLIKDFWMNYEIEVGGKGIFSGDYEIKVYLEPSSVRNAPHWSKELPFSRKGILSESGTSDRLKIDWKYVLNLWNDIQREIGVAYTSPSIKIVSEIKLRGSAGEVGVERNIIHEARIYYGKTLSFEKLTLEKSEKMFKDVKVINRFGNGSPSLSPSAAKFGLGVIAVVSGASLILLSRKTVTDYASSFLERRRIGRFKRKYGSLVVRINSSLPHTRTVRVGSLDDLGKLAFELEKPILETDDFYGVMDGDILYAVKKYGEHGMDRSQVI
jgi:hypothetical protein